MSGGEKIIALMYHGIDSVDDPSEMTDKGDLVYVVDMEDFKMQMGLLREAGLPVVTLPRPGKADPEGSTGTGDVPVVLTFDDGHVTNYTKALDVLVGFGFTGHFFVTSDNVGRPRFMTKEMVRGLHDAGMIVGSHGKTHRFLTDLSDGELDRELRESKERLEGITGSQVNSFSAPGGRMDERVMRALKKNGYSLVFDSTPVIGPSRTSGAIGRFTVKRGLKLAKYKKMVTGRPPFFEHLKYRTLSYAKVLLGNDRYRSLRDAINTFKG